jgi:hypothetical protein
VIVTPLSFIVPNICSFISCRVRYNCGFLDSVCYFLQRLARTGLIDFSSCWSRRTKVFYGHSRQAGGIFKLIPALSQRPFLCHLPVVLKFLLGDIIAVIFCIVFKLLPIIWLWRFLCSWRRMRQWWWCYCLGIGQFPSIMVAFIHQNSKSSYAQIFFASKAIAPKALRSLRFMVWVATTKLCLLSTAAWYYNLSQLLLLELKGLSHLDRWCLFGVVHLF